MAVNLKSMKYRNEFLPQHKTIVIMFLLCLSVTKPQPKETEWTTSEQRMRLVKNHERVTASKLKVILLDSASTIADVFFPLF